MSVGKLWATHCSSWTSFKSRVWRESIKSHAFGNLPLWYPIYSTSFLHTYLMNSLSIRSYFSSLIYLIFIEALLMFRDSPHLYLLFICPLLWHSMHFNLLIWWYFGLIMFFRCPSRKHRQWVLPPHFHSGSRNSTFVWKIWYTGSCTNQWGSPLIAFF